MLRQFSINFRSDIYDIFIEIYVCCNVRLGLYEFTASQVHVLVPFPQGNGIKFYSLNSAPLFFKLCYSLKAD